jgi:hypothetical protein
LTLPKIATRHTLVGSMTKSIRRPKGGRHRHGYGRDVAIESAAISPMVASAAMSLSSVSVIANALRLRSVEL